MSTCTPTFRPVGTYTYLSVQYQRTGGNAFSCISLEVTKASTELKCRMRAMQDAGGGATTNADITYTVTLTVGNQVFSSGGLFTYERPVITGATSPSLYGGQITITGRNFGPAGANIPGLQMSDASGSYTVSVANTPTGQAAPVVATEDTKFTSWIPRYTSG